MDELTSTLSAALGAAIEAGDEDAPDADIPQSGGDDGPVGTVDAAIDTPDVEGAVAPARLEGGE